MGVKLCMPVEPFWLDLADGVRFYVRPMTAVTHEVARVKAIERLRVLSLETTETDKLGGELVGLHSLEDPVASAAYLNVLLAREIAHAAVVRWENVADEKGRPIDATWDAIEAFFMLPGRMDDFLARYEATVSEVFKLEKPLPVEPTGGLGEAGTIATDVSNSTGWSLKNFLPKFLRSSAAPTVPAESMN